MAKLSEEVLAEGRTFVEAQDLEGLKVWCETHAPTVTWSEVEKTFALIFKAGDTPRALKLFDRFFPTVDPARDVRQALAKLGCLLFLALGALGGVVYLVSVLL